HSLLLAEQFNDLRTDLDQIVTDLSGTISAGVDEINQITAGIGQLNLQIVRMETTGVANDLRDQRNALISELAEYIDVQLFEQSDGSISVVAPRGCILADGANSFELELGGSTGDRIRWLGTGGTAIDITGNISNGKLGGWLNMRDETIVKNKLDLDAVVKELIWSVNQQHSQGVGLKLFEPGSTISGTYQTATDLGDLEFGDRVQFIADGFKLWIEDRTVPGNPTMDSVSVNLSTISSASSLAELAAEVNSQITADGLMGVTVGVSGTTISFTAAGNYAFGFSDDDSNILAALGVNTFFQGAGSGSIEVNTILNDKDYIAAAQIDAGGGYGAGDNANALATLDLQYTSMEISQWTCDRTGGNTEGKVTTTIEGYYHAMLGAIGIKSSSIASTRAFNEEMVNKLNSIRDSISAVSLDEEMTNLISYQHAFAAAAKLLGAADEMMKTLLDAY
ncbi:MAG: hypothetical protein KKH68_02275, partial [Proteobacteria bacterium]|nr:hypothetical protein [Pseudomonadota bacterium]